MLHHEPTWRDGPRGLLRHHSVAGFHLQVSVMFLTSGMLHREATWPRWFKKAGRPQLEILWHVPFMEEARSHQKNSGQHLITAACDLQVALMFLTRGMVHHEPTWTRWFKEAEGLTRTLTSTP